MLIRVDTELSDQLHRRLPAPPPRHAAGRTTTLTGELTDQQELQGVLDLRNSLGIGVVEVVTISD